MLKETEGRGAYCSLVMAVIVVKDVVTFLGFAINIELLQAVRASRFLCTWVHNHLVPHLNVNFLLAGAAPGSDAATNQLASASQSSYQD